MGKRFLACLAGLGLMAGCTHYPYAENVKMISYDDDVTAGKSVGPIRGADCTWTILGYKLGGQPTLDRAMANARLGTGESLSDQWSSKKGNGETLRYINNVSTEYDGFNAGIIAKNCLIVKGAGYR